MLEKKEKIFTKIINYLTFKKRKQNKKNKTFFYTKQTTERIQTWINIHCRRYIWGHLSRHFCVKIQMVYVGFMTNDIFQILYFLSIISKQREYDRNLLFIYQCTLLMAAYKGSSSFNDSTIPSHSYIISLSVLFK